MIDSPSDCPFATSPLCSTLATVQLIIIDLLHFLVTERRVNSYYMVMTNVSK